MCQSVRENIRLKRKKSNLDLIRKRFHELPSGICGFLFSMRAPGHYGNTSIYGIFFSNPGRHQGFAKKICPHFLPWNT